MKVLFVCSGNSPFGISPIIKSQGESLKRNGVSIQYFPIYGKGFTGYLKNIPKLRKFILKNNFDIIHAHYGLCGIITQIARKNVRLVVSFMGDDLIGSMNSKSKYTIISRMLSWLNRHYARNKYEYVIVKSTQLAKLIGDYDNLAIIPNGVDFTKFYPVSQYEARVKLKLDQQCKIIIFVSDPNRSEKNFALARTAYEQLNDKRIKLITVFDRDHESLNLYYNAANVLLLTSHHEGSPNVIKEAMACNLPIVSTDVGDVREVIGSTEGCFITIFDPKDVANKLRLGLEFNQRTNGREKIQHLEINTVAKRIKQIYKKVLEKN